MALRLGWKPGDKRVSYYWRDPSVDWDATPEDARQAYLKDGDASYLVITNGVTPPPTKIVIRALDAEEKAAIIDRCSTLVRRNQAESDEDYAARLERDGGVDWNRLLFWAFAVGCELPDEPSAKKVLGPGGLIHLPREVLNAIVATYGDDPYVFFGRLVWDASRLTEDEKKVLP